MNRKPPTTNRFILWPFVAMIRRHWLPMALGGLLSLLAALAAIGLLSLSGWFIAATAYAGLNVATAKAFNFFLPSIGVRIFAMTRTAARYGERVISHDATFRILETLRTWCYTRIEPLAPARLERHHSGDLLTRIITDIDTLDNLYLRVLSPSVVAATVAALLTAFIWSFDIAMALLNAGLLITAGVVVPMFADRAARTAAQRLNAQTGRLRTALVDGIHGLAALLTCGAEIRYHQRVERRHQDLVRSQNTMSNVSGLTKAATGLISGLAIAATLYIGVDNVSRGTLSGPLLALLVLAVMAAYDIVVPLSGAFQYLGQTRKAAGRLRNITEQPPAVTFPETQEHEPLDGPIAFSDVSFGYAGAGRLALQKINFHINPGQHTAIMGATGAGKSTIFHLLARFEDPDAGSIRLGNTPLNAIPEAILRRHICIVDQRAHIFNGTLRDNLLLARPDATTDELHDALAVVRLTTFVKKLPQGLDTWVGDAGRLLSGGQARRLAIARAVLGNAPVWALDEPTEGLDGHTADAMMRELLQYGRQKTLITITHRPEAIEKMDQIILLEDGRITRVGSPGKRHLQES